jgi:hypothetical protein
VIDELKRVLLLCHAVEELTFVACHNPGFPALRPEWSLERRANSNLVGHSFKLSAASNDLDRFIRIGSHCVFFALSTSASRAGKDCEHHVGSSEEVRF